MPYGTLKVDNITYTAGGSDATTTVSGLVNGAGFGNLSVTGTISGATITGNVANFTTITAVTGIFTNTLSGATVTGALAQFTSGVVKDLVVTNSLVSPSGTDFSVAGNIVVGGSGYFASGISVTGTVSGQTITGSAGNFTTVTGGTVTCNGILTSASGIRLSSYLDEGTKVTAGKLSDNTAINLVSGMVHFFTTTETTTSTPNIRFSATETLDSVLGVGETASVTVITTAAAAAYSNSVQIDGSTGNRTLRFQGGAPTAGGASGNDVYTYQIIKTASNTFTVLASVANYV